EEHPIRTRPPPFGRLFIQRLRSCCCRPCDQSYVGKHEIGDARGVLDFVGDGLRNLVDDGIVHSLQPTHALLPLIRASFFNSSSRLTCARALSSDCSAWVAAAVGGSAQPVASC